MNRLPAVRRATASLLALLLTGLTGACGRPQRRETASAPESPAGVPPGIFGLAANPGATVLTAVDPHTLSPTELQFGVAPRRSAAVDYQDGIILMEQGDKAIRSVAGDGLTWKFDANAPHVNEFQEGKIVFATGRAVGRIIGLKREGDTVSAILGPVQLTDVIKNGSFVMSQPVDVDKMISYVAPDYPQPPEQQPPPSHAESMEPDNHIDRSVVVSQVRSGVWTPTSVAQTYADGRRVTYRKMGDRWSAPHVSYLNVSQARFARSFGGVPLTPVVLTGQQVTPGIPQLPHPPAISNVQLPPAKTVGTPPVVNIGDVRTVAVANNSGIGLQFYYNKNGLNVSAYSLLSLRSARVDFELLIQNAKIVKCGINIGGAVGVKLHLDSYSTQDFSVNFHKLWWEPVDLSIPLGLNSASPVPFAVTFNESFSVSTGFSAKQSIMKAEGDYAFDGGLWGGYKDGHWSVSVPTHVTANTDLGQSIQGISVGINSLVLGCSVRAMVGIGAFGFNTGVFGGIRFAGTMLRAADITWPCRQGTIEAFLDAGIGYSLPPVFVDALNAVLRLFTKYQIDRVGTLTQIPPTRLFHGITQIPGGCSTPKSGGGAQ